MARRQRLLTRIGAPLALVFCQPLAALEPMTAAELVSACRTYLEDSRSAAAANCRAYVLGYLSASNEIVAEEERPSGFVARAMRTRASRLSDAAEQRLSSRFCLPEGETLDGLIGRLAAGPAQYATDAEASLVMRDLFEKHYRCDVVMES